MKVFKYCRNHFPFCHKMLTDPLIYNCDFKTWKIKVEKKKLKKKVEKWALKFWKPFFFMFSRFFTKLCCKWFLKSFEECLTRFCFFSFLKIIFRHWIWNEIPENLEQNCFFKTVFCLLFGNGFWSLLLFFGTCCVKMYLLFLSLWECLLGGCRFENIFWCLSLRKWFFALVALQIIFCSYCFENYFWLQLL